MPECEPLTENERIVAAATSIQKDIDRLYDEQSDLLDPVYDRAEDMGTEELLWWVKNMPPGFHRSEMRGILRRRKGDDWCVEQHIMVKTT